MADLRQTMRTYFRDNIQLGYQISKAEFERLADVFHRTGENDAYSFLRQTGAGDQRRIMDKAELRAVADYGRAANDLFVAWQAVRVALHQEIEDRDEDVAFQGFLDQLDALLQQAEALTVPDRAAAVQRVFLAMLGSERAYFQHVFDDVDDAVIAQYAADFQVEATTFLAECDRLLR
jgi:hypothetical protein